METIRIQVKAGIYNQIMGLLHQFKADEVQVLKEDAAFIATQAHLKTAMQNIDSGQANFDSLETLEHKLEARIKKHEG